MAALQALVRNLRRAEQQLLKQLSGVRQAISSLEFGSGAVPFVGGRKRRRPTRGVRKRRPLSRKARKAISDAQKRRWAKQKAS
jgi:hypothetical protein